MRAIIKGVILGAGKQNDTDDGGWSERAPRSDADLDDSAHVGDG